MSFTNEIWLAIRSDVADEGGDGTPSSPYAVNTPEGFANVLSDPAKAFKQNSIIRLGPGLFRTRGGGGNGLVSADSTDFWTARSGQKIVGSGMFSTTLQFVWDLAPTGHPGQRHFMIQNPTEYLRSFEISDLTLDCNLQNAPFDTSPVLAAPGTASLTNGQTTVTSSSSFFDSSMTGKIVYFFKDEALPAQDFFFSAKIDSIQSDAQATLDRAPSVSGGTKSGISFWVFWPKFTVTAAAIAGDSIRIRRVRMINFGTRTPALYDGLGQPAAPSPNRTYEGFPVMIVGRTADTPSFNSWMEDCVIEQPYPGPAREVTQVVGGGVATWANPNPPFNQKLHLEPFGCGIRNCYMNFDFVNPRPGNPIPIFSISYTGSAPNVDATVTTLFPLDVAVNDYVEMYGNSVTTLNGRFKVTAIGSPDPIHKLIVTFTFRIGTNPGSSSYGFAFKSPLQTMPVTLALAGSTVTARTPQKHHRVAGEWVVISGADQPEYNGTFAVLSTGLDDTHFQYSVSGSPGSPTGDIWLDRRPNGIVRIKKVTRLADESGAPIGEIETHAPHYRKPGDWILPTFPVRTTGDPGTTNNSYNNYVEIIGVIDRFKFKCKLPGAVNIGSAGNPGTDFPQGADTCISYNYQATYANGGFGGGVHSNRIAHANHGAYHDFYWHRDLILRKNYFYNVNRGVIFVAADTYAGGDPPIVGDSPWRNATVQSRSGTLLVLLFDTTNADPGFIPGVVVRISKQSNTLVYADAYVTAVAWESSKFKVTARSPSASDFTQNDLVYCDLWFQQSLFQIEDNIFEVALAPLGYMTVSPVGVLAEGPWWNGSVPGNPYVINPVYGLEDGWNVQLGIIRDNLIRKVGNGSDPIQAPAAYQTLSSGIRINSCENLIVEGNIIGQMSNALLSWTLQPHEVDYSNARTYKAFNNQYPTGRLRQLFNDPSWEGNLEFWVDEIETLADDMLWVWNKKPGLLG
jgi:hypothetical protein